MIAFGSCPDLNGAKTILVPGCMVVEMNGVGHHQWPKSLVVLLWPEQSCMKHKNSCMARNVFDGIFCRPILMMGTNTTEALPLAVFLEVQCEVLGCVDTIVSILFLDSVAKMCCLPLKNNFRTYGILW
jgi:hypothetical protein